jgi:N-acyl-D-amino-acid deacylase
MSITRCAEDDVARFLAEPWIAVASDSGIRSEGSGKPHPRGSGNNVRVLGRYVREKKVLPLEVAVQKMTSVPARAFGIEGRGELKRRVRGRRGARSRTVADRAT